MEIRNIFSHPLSAPSAGDYYDAILPDGSKYTGPMKDGKPHGHGGLVFPPGQKYDRYVGEFVDGRIEGKGTIYWSSGYEEGRFKNGEMVEGTVYKFPLER